MPLLVFDEGIHVLRHEEMLLVKRPSLNPSTRNVTISSDNPAYLTYPDCSWRSVDTVAASSGADAELAKNRIFSNKTSAPEFVGY
jgi:hypothetical protein